MTSVAYRWDVESFLRAHDAGAFRTRVELVEGEVWPVVHGDWHGRVPFRVAAALDSQGEVTSATLATQGSLPDPDLWVKRQGAQPVDRVSARLSRWDPADVLLVVEVSDETLDADLTVKARLYARAGYRHYWVITRDGVHEHSRPSPEGYAEVRLCGPGEHLPLPDGGSLPVDRLLSD